MSSELEIRTIERIEGPDDTGYVMIHFKDVGPVYFHKRDLNKKALRKLSPGSIVYVKKENPQSTKITEMYIPKLLRLK